MALRGDAKFVGDFPGTIESIIERCTRNTVYRATVAGQAIALKVFRETDPGDELYYLYRFRGFPHIVQIFDIYDNSYSMELAECSLDRLRPFHLDIPDYFSTRAHEWARQLICAVEYCHSKGVIHTDIRPNNLLLFDKKRVLKLADFDCAVLMSDPKNHLVTAQWHRAPESHVKVQSAEGKLEYSWDSAIDIWACGHCLYEIGRGDWFELFRPTATPLAMFQELGLPDYARGAVDDPDSYPAPRPFTRASDMHPKFANTITRALTVNPSQRPTAKGLLALWDAS